MVESNLVNSQLAQVSGHTTSVSEPRLRDQRLIANLVLAFFICIPMEGILRKWIFNSFQQAFLFIRDPILIAIYVIYARRVTIRTSAWLIYWFAGTSALVALILLQASSSALNPIVYLLGLRNYVMYIPLTFIMSEMLASVDLDRYVRVALLMIVPVAILVAIQFSSPPSSPINKGLTEDVAGRFLLVEGIVRPYGPFTFVEAQATFAVLMAATALIGFTRYRRMGIRAAVWVGIGLACFAMGALSGARTYFFGASIVLLFYVVAGFTSPRIALGALRVVSTLALVAAFGIVFVLVFPRAFEATMERQTQATHAEGSTIDRALSLFTTVSTALEQAPALGVGLGAGSNAGAAVRGDLTDWSYGEYDWPRIVMEIGPFAGVVYLGFRVLLFCYILLRAVMANRKRGDSAALIMFGIAGPTLLVAQITGQNQMLSFCWFTCGLTLALANGSRAIDSAN